MPSNLALISHAFWMNSNWREIFALRQMKYSPLRGSGASGCAAAGHLSLIAKFAPAPDDAMGSAGGDQILAQVLMAEAQHADQPRQQTPASARHVAGPRIGTTNMRPERTSADPPGSVIVGELIARDIEVVRTHTADRLRARGHQHIARHRATYERLRECYRCVIVVGPQPR